MTGVTTAATLWIVTAISLCFGGGQFGIGAAGTVLAIAALYVLKAVDRRIVRRNRGMLELVAAGAPRPDLDDLVGPFGVRSRFVRQAIDPATRNLRVWYEVQWSQAEAHPPQIAFLQTVAAHHEVVAFDMRVERDL